MATLTIGNPATLDEEEVQTRFPVDEGTSLGITKIEGKEMFLIPTEKSLVKAKDKIGIY